MFLVAKSLKHNSMTFMHLLQSSIITRINSYNIEILTTIQCFTQHICVY